MQEQEKEEEDLGEETAKREAENGKVERGQRGQTREKTAEMVE